MSDHHPFRPSWPPVLSRAAGLAVLLSLAALPVAAQMYKWVDEQGNVHYTQERPPPGIKGESIKPPPPVDSEAAQQALDARQEFLNEAGEARSKGAEEAKLAAEDKAFREENCRRARASVAAFSIPNALVQQPDGSRTRYSEEERLKGLADAEARVRDFCD